MNCRTTWDSPVYCVPSPGVFLHILISPAVHHNAKVQAVQELILHLQLKKHAIQGLQKS